MSANPDSNVSSDEVTCTSGEGTAESSTMITTTSCTCATSDETNEITIDLAAGGVEQKNLEMLANLWPKGTDPSISVDELLDFFSQILGPFYNKEVATCLIDIMEPDVEGKISRENFARAFCLDNWPKDHVAAMRRVFITRPEIINEIVDWRAVIDRMGLDMTESELSELIEHAKATASQVLKRDESEISDSTLISEKVEQKTEEILKMIMDKLGKTSIHDCASRNLPSGEAIEPTKTEK